MNTPSWQNRITIELANKKKKDQNHRNMFKLDQNSRLNPLIFISVCIHIQSESDPCKQAGSQAGTMERVKVLSLCRKIKIGVSIAWAHH